MFRGDVHVINLSTAVGHEQRGRRYAVVVQSSALLLSTAIICPTSTSARATSFRPEVDVDGGATLVMCDQLQAVDVTRLGAIVGHVSHDEMRDIEEGPAPERAPRAASRARYRSSRALVPEVTGLRRRVRGGT